MLSLVDNGRFHFGFCLQMAGCAFPECTVSCVAPNGAVGSSGCQQGGMKAAYQGSDEAEVPPSYSQSLVFTFEDCLHP